MQVEAGLVTHSLPPSPSGYLDPHSGLPCIGHELTNCTQQSLSSIFSTHLAPIDIRHNLSVFGMFCFLYLTSNRPFSAPDKIDVPYPANCIELMWALLAQVEDVDAIPGPRLFSTTSSCVGARTPPSSPDTTASGAKFSFEPDSAADVHGVSTSALSVSSSSFTAAPVSLLYIHSELGMRKFIVNLCFIVFDIVFSSDRRLQTSSSV